MKVMCMAQTEAEELNTGLKDNRTPKFGDILTVVIKVYNYQYKEDYYLFAEFGNWPGGCMFQAKFFTPVDEVAEAQLIAAFGESKMT